VSPRSCSYSSPRLSLCVAALRKLPFEQYRSMATLRHRAAAWGSSLRYALKASTRVLAASSGSLSLLVCICAACSKALPASTSMSQLRQRQAFSAGLSPPRRLRSG